MHKIIVLITLNFILLNSPLVVAQDDDISVEESHVKEQSIWSDISSGAQSFTQSTLEKAGKLSDDMGEVYDDAVILSKDSLNDFLAGMDEKVKLLGQLGYDITDVYINVGLIPDLSFKVARVKTLRIEKQNEILQSQQAGVVMHYVINKLNQAYDMQVKGYHIKDVKIRLTFTPGATVHFVKNNEASSIK
jgi:hypothetical protein